MELFFLRATCLVLLCFISLPLSADESAVRWVNPTTGIEWLYIKGEFTQAEATQQCRTAGAIPAVEFNKGCSSYNSDGIDKYCRSATDIESNIKAGLPVALSDNFWGNPTLKADKRAALCSYGYFPNTKGEYTVIINTNVGPSANQFRSSIEWAAHRAFSIVYNACAKRLGKDFLNPPRPVQAIEPGKVYSEEGLMGSGAIECVAYSVVFTCSPDSN